MKALLKLKPEKGLWLQDVPLPTIQDDEVLIKIKTIALCGTDLHIYRWDGWAQKHIETPLIIGHEFIGEIAAIGKRVTHLSVGERVSGEGHITCGHCRNCREGQQHLCPNTIGIGIQRNGAFAEYLALPARNVIPIPPALSDDVATILDPLGNAVHTALKFDLVGEDVLITGAGPIGLMATAIAKQIGAKNIVVTDLNDYRLKLAKDFGATKTINIQDLSLTQILSALGKSFDFTVGLEMSGHIFAYQLMLESLSYGAHLALLGIPEQELSLDFNKIIFKGLTLKGIYGRKMFETWDKMIHLLESGLKISHVITHHFKAEAFEQAFAKIGSGEAGKIILSW